MPFFGPFTLSEAEVPSAAGGLRGLPGFQSLTSYPGPGGTGTGALGYTLSGDPYGGSRPVNLQEALGPRLQGPSTAAYNPGAGFFEGAAPVQAESITGMLSGPSTPSVGGEPGVASAPGAPSGAGGLGGIIGEIGGLISEVSSNTPAARGFNAMGLPGWAGNVVASAAPFGLGLVNTGFGIANTAISGPPAISPETAQGLPAFFQGLEAAMNARPSSTPPAAPPDPVQQAVDAAMGTSGPSGGLSGMFTEGPNVAFGLGAQQTNMMSDNPDAPVPDAPDPAFGGEEAGPPGTTGPPADPGPTGTGDSGDGGVGATVICTVLYKHGYLDEKTWLADRLFGSLIDPAVYLGYIRWARPLADAMHRAPLLRWLVSLVACRWARAMAGERNLIGDLVMRLGVPLCRWLGRKVALA